MPFIVIYFTSLIVIYDIFIVVKIITKQMHTSAHHISKHFLFVYRIIGKHYVVISLCCNSFAAID